MNVLHIARFTLQEAINRRLILAGVLISLAFVGLYTLGFSLLFQNVFTPAMARRADPSTETILFGTMMTILGLYAVHFLSSFLALFLSVGAVSGEIDSGTLHAVLARPIRRAEFVLGRWLAYSLMMAVYVAVMATLLLLIARLIAGFQAPDPLRAVALMALGAVVLLSVSLFGSTLLSTLANGVVVFTLFGLAWMAGIIEMVGTVLSNQAMVNLGIAVSLLVPTDAVWRGASYYVQPSTFLAGLMAGRDVLPFASSSAPTLPMIVWAVVHPLVFLGASVAAFSRRDL